MSNTQLLAQPIIEIFAGFTAGVATTIVVQPLDLIKTRLQGVSILGCFVDKS